MVKYEAEILLLPLNAPLSVMRRVTRHELTRRHSFLAANSHGSYALIRGMWGNLEGQYDALLADAGIADTTLVWHPGGHFDQPDARMIAGFAWLLKKL